MKITECFDMYIDYARLKNIAKDSLIHIEATKKSLVEIHGDIEIDKLTLKKISDWYAWLRIGRGENTCRNYVCLLRVVLKFLQKNHVACIDCELVPVPKRQPNTPTFINAKEVARIIESSSSIRTKFIVSLLYSSGIRVSELISLNRGQIRDREFTVIGKGKKERLCFIDSRTERLMYQYLETRNDSSDALIVTKQNGSRPHKSTIELIIKNAVKKAGLYDKHITPHTFRHSFATNYLQNNGNMRYLSEILGHSSLQTTSIYTHVVNNDLKKHYQMYHTI